MVLLFLSSFSVDFSVVGELVPPLEVVPSSAAVRPPPTPVQVAPRQLRSTRQFCAFLLVSYVFVLDLPH
jgi:hypothetical protein